MALPIRPIKTEEDYETALERIDALMDAEAGSDEADELEVLATLVELYEDKVYPMDFPDPIEAIHPEHTDQSTSNRSKFGADPLLHQSPDMLLTDYRLEMGYWNQ